MENKTKHHRIKLTISIIILSLLIIGCSKEKEENFTSIMNKLDFKIDIKEEFSILENSLIENDNQDITKIISSNNNDIIKIFIVNNLDENESKTYIDNEIYLLNSQFNEYTSPYPGPLSKKRICSKEFIPKLEEENTTDSKRLFYYLYANDRFTYSGCTPDSVTYELMLSFIYCKEKKQVYKIEYFTPKDNPTNNYKDIVKSFECER